MTGISKSRNNRLNYLTQKIEKEGILRTDEICKELNLSGMTITRDINLLSENRNYYERFYGGLKKRGRLTSLDKFFIQWDENRQEKTQIAKKVSALLKSGERIFLASGTTTFFVAQEICRRNDLVILTNSLPIACLFPGNSQLVVIFLGGSLIPGELDTHDIGNQDFIKELGINKAILGTWGIDSQEGLTTAYSEGMNRT